MKLAQKPPYLDGPTKSAKIAWNRNKTLFEEFYGLGRSYFDVSLYVPCVIEEFKVIRDGDSE